MIPSSLQPFVVDRPRENWRAFGDPASPQLRVLRFDDEAAQIAAFAAAGIAAPEGLGLSSDFFWPGIGDISILGRVVDQQAVPGEPDEDGLPTIAQEATYLPGWFVNVLLAEPAPVGTVGETPTPGPALAPLAISPRQARLALLSLGLLDQVNDLVAQGPAELRIAWDYSLEVRRDDPGVIALATQLGIADQLTDLFAMAATL